MGTDQLSAVAERVTIHNGPAAGPRWFVVQVANAFSGTFVTLARDDVLAAGMTINGLPIMLKRPNAFTMDIDNLDIYYEDCVIGGPGAFVVPIREREQFKTSSHRNLRQNLCAPCGPRLCMY